MPPTRSGGFGRCDVAPHRPRRTRCGCRPGVGASATPPGADTAPAAVSVTSAMALAFCSSVPISGDLTRRDHDRPHRLAQLDLRRVGRSRTMASHGVASADTPASRPASVSANCFFAVDRLAPDESLVFKQGQGRVDGPRARLPDSARALLELLDHLVAVHRALGQQCEQGDADVAAARATRTRTAATAESRTRSASTRATVVMAAPVRAEPAASGLKRPRHSPLWSSSRSVHYHVPTF